MSDNGKRKDVNIDVPCAHYEIKPHAPNQKLITFHLVLVPSDALTEVQEVLKKYQSSFDAFNEAIKKQSKSPEIKPT
jgi:hypothetical protein